MIGRVLKISWPRAMAARAWVYGAWSELERLRHASNKVNTRGLNPGVNTSLMPTKNGLVDSETGPPVPPCAFRFPAV